MEGFNEKLKFYEENADFKQYIDKCVQTYGKDVSYMIQTPIADEYYKSLNGGCNDRSRRKDI